MEKKKRRVENSIIELKLPFNVMDAIGVSGPLYKMCK